MIDPEDYKNKLITTSVNKEGEKTRMSYYEIARWMALIEGMEIINNNGIDTDDIKIKINALNDYIDDRMHIMLYDIINQNVRYNDVEITEQYLHASKIDTQT